MSLYPHSEAEVRCCKELGSASCRNDQWARETGRNPVVQKRGVGVGFGEVMPWEERVML